MPVLNYLSKFEEVFNSLNEQQKKAVQHIEGPVLVMAGPGTGKTQILAARIARILLETDALPENILCLTYTDAGAVAMRKRLQEFIGPDSYRVQISTFHGFCNKVIQENLDVFGFRNLDAITDLEHVQFLKNLIDELPKNHPIKRYTGDAYYEINRLKILFDLMKKEDWSPTFMLTKIDQYCKDLPTREEFLYKRKTTKDGKVFEKGDVKQDVLNKALNGMSVLKGAVELFEPYQKVLKDNNRYDFSDMILWVIHAFKTDAGLLADYQEKYQFVLVDEFQDTSGSQNDLLSLLLNYWDVPNVFAVGDDDQSIYRFQGANIENIQQFIQQYGSYIKKVTLEDNYRSTQPILDAARKLISRNSQRIAHDKILYAKNPERQQNPFDPKVVYYYNPIHESSDICKQIQEIHLTGTPLHEIAVLYRNHQQADEMIQYLKSKNIEVNSRKRVNILLEPIIKKILRVMLFVSAESEKAFSGESYLFEMLHYHEFQIPSLEIARLSVSIASKNFNERTTSWREELNKLAKKKQGDLFEASTHGTAFARFSETIELLIKNNINQTPLETIHEIIRVCGFLAGALTHEEKTWQMEVLRTFFDFIKLECQKNPTYKLKQLTETILLMEENKIALSAEKVIYSESGVNFITAHSSKGLEFDYVFIIGCNTKPWDENVRNRTYSLPDNLFNLSGDETEETRRLFYVAMTRARKYLQMSYSKQDLKSKDLEPSKFIAEITEDKIILPHEVQVTPEELMDFEFSAVNQSQQSNLPSSILDNAFTDTLLEKYSLSVTHLNGFLKCPISFYFNNFIKVPAPRSASMTFGSAVHFALEQLFKKMNADENKMFGNEASLLQDFKWFMRRNQDSFTEAEYKRKIEYGEEILPRYYQEYINQWNKITSVEKSYRNVLVKGVPINGKLDKMEFDGNFVNVVDYKTGSYKNAKNKFGRPDPNAVAKAIAEGKEPKFEDVYGGDYWRQAVFYKLIMDHDATKKWEMRSSEFDFIEPLIQIGENGSNQYKFHKERVEIIPEDLGIVSQQIESVYAKIKAKEFSPGCGKPECHWCNFTKDFYQSSADALKAPGTLTNKEDEEEDLS